MANTYTKTVKSNEGTRKLTNGNSLVYTFNVPQPASKFSSISVNLPLYVNVGENYISTPYGSAKNKRGAALTFYISFDNGSYINISDPVWDKNATGNITYTPDLKSIAPDSFSKCSIKLVSESNSSASGLGVSGYTKYGDVTMYQASLSVTSSVSAVSVTSLSPSGGTYPISQSKMFSWTLNAPGIITKQQIKYRLSTSETWSTVNVNVSTNSYTFAKNFFKQGYYYWYISATDTFGNVIESNTATVTFGKKPTVSITFPSSTGFWRSKSNTFQWTYKDDLNLYQKEWEIGFKLTSASSWTTIKATNQNTSYTFAANYFSYAKYNLRIRAKNEDGIWSDYATLTFQAGSVPSISLNTPDNNAVLRNSTANYVTWTLSDTLNTGQKAYEFRYRLSNSTTWTTKSVTSTSSSYSIAAGSLSQGKYAWQVRVQNNDGNWTAWSSERTFVYGVKSTLELLSPTDGEVIRLLSATVVSWKSTNDYGIGQSSFELGYKLSNASSWTTKTGTTSNSYTIASGSLSYGYYNFRLRIKNADNIWSDYVYFNEQVGSTPSIEITYPIDCTIKRDIGQIFTWKLTDTLNTGQKRFEFSYKLKTSGTWTTKTGTTNKEYYSFTANTFAAGEYQWRIKVTNNDGISTGYVYAEFVVIGETAAPVITNVTQSAIPTFTWTVTSQDTFEFELYHDNERIYTSGVQKGFGIRTYTPNIMIDDGNYVVKMRSMNEYGYFTDWMTYSFVLETVKPEALPCYIFANEYYGVTVARSLELDPVESVPSSSTSPTPDAYYVLRRVNGETEWNIIGKLSTSDESVKFVDNTVQKNVEYEYAIRNYKEEAGYTDSDSHLIMIRHKGVIIYNGDDLVNLTLSEKSQFDITHTPNKAFNYAQMIGRTYPVRESSEWMTHSTSFSCYASFEQFNKLNEMLTSNNDLWFKGKDFSFACAIDTITITASHLDKGYDISVVVSRINEEDFVLI